MRTAQALAHGRSNNFDAIRFAAASAVILGHAFPLSGTPSLYFLPGYDLGRASVTVFFGISGFLIVRSYLQTPALVDFATARFMRLMPGLVTMLTITALLLGPSVTSLQVLIYLNRKEVWGYLVHNTFLWNLRFTLPGVFEHNPFPGSVVGSIWTLPYEVGCYLATALIGVAGLLRGSRAIVFAMLYAAAYAAGRGVWSGPPPFWAELSLPLVYGGAIYLLRDRIPLTAWALALMGGVTVLCWHTALAREVLCLTTVYTAFVVAALPWERLHRFGRRGDFSYGIYIYAFPVEQTVAWAKPGIGPAALAITTFVLSMPLAVASWHLIEHRALAQRHRIGRTFAATARLVRKSVLTFRCVL